MKVKNKTIEILESEYFMLLERDLFLSCLEGCGVDNWQGYGAAQEMMGEEEE